MIFFWILVVLVILAVSVGQRASMTFKYTRYQKDRQKALYLAKAGINRAITELTKDINDYDALDESWADNKEIFEKITLTEVENEFASVNYTREVEGRVEEKFGVRDEEGKININTAPEELLIALLENFNILDAPQVAKNIRIWRGDIPDDNKTYEELGYAPKAEKFANSEELMLVKGITPQDYQKLKEDITVYTDGLININTVSEGVLNIAACAVSKKLKITEGFAKSLSVKILATRDNRGGYFTNKTEIDVPTAGSEEKNIFNELMNSLTTKSNNFFIAVTANAGKIENRVNAVYSRKENKFKYWHEE